MNELEEQLYEQFRNMWNALPESDRACAEWVMSEDELRRIDSIMELTVRSKLPVSFGPGTNLTIFGKPIRLDPTAARIALIPHSWVATALDEARKEAAMSDEKLINVAFNEPRCGRFEMYDNGEPDEHTHTLPESLWRAVAEAEEAMEAARTNYRAALTAALDHIKATADRGDDVRDFQIDEHGIYW